MFARQSARIISHQPLSTTHICSPVFGFSTMAEPKLLKTAVVIPPKGEHKNTVIFLHGLGDEGASFVDVFDMLNLPNTRVILPNAPKRPITCNGGYVMPGWYDIYSMGPGRALTSAQDEKGIEESTAALTELLDAEVKKVAGPENIVIGGFSQGAAMTMHTGLQYSQKLGGVIAASGYALLHHLGDKFIKQPDLSMLVYHGVNDPVVPIDLARLSQDHFKKHGVKNIEYIEEPRLVHSLSNPELRKFAEFLKKTLP